MTDVTIGVGNGMAVASFHGGVPVLIAAFSWDPDDGLIVSMPAASLNVEITQADTRVMAVHPAASLDGVIDALRSIHPLILTALLAEEAGWAPMSDPMGVIALRAVERAIRGEQPGTPGEMSLDGPVS